MPEDVASVDGRKLHAGVESDGLIVVAFDSVGQLRTLLAQIGIVLDPVGRLLDEHGKRIGCCGCDKDITVDDVSHVLPGSTYVYCKDPACVLDYLERFG